VIPSQRVRNARKVVIGYMKSEGMIEDDNLYIFEGK
jgi:hypothetical protein